MATWVLLSLLTVVVLLSTSPGRPIVYVEKHKVLWSTLLQPERPPEPTLDVSRSMLGARVAILKLTQMSYTKVSPWKKQRSAQIWVGTIAGCSPIYKGEK